MDDRFDLLFENYRSLLSKVDLFLRNAQAAFARDLVCRKGCHACCRHLTLFPVEALHIRFVLKGTESRFRKKVRDRASFLINTPEGECPLLDQGECLLYQARPLICRTHGFPVLVRVEDGVAVDYCPLNFTSGRKPVRSYILDIEKMTETLVAINRLFIKNGYEAAGLPERITLAKALLLHL